MCAVTHRTHVISFYSNALIDNTVQKWQSSQSELLWKNVRAKLSKDWEQFI